MFIKFLQAMRIAQREWKVRRIAVSSIISCIWLEKPENSCICFCLNLMSPLWKLQSGLLITTRVDLVWTSCKRELMTSWLLMKNALNRFFYPPTFWSISCLLSSGYSVFFWSNAVICIEQEKQNREAKAAEGGWTVVVHHKGRKKTTEAETGTTVGSVSQTALEDKVAKKKQNESVAHGFYRFQRREAQRNGMFWLFYIQSFKYGLCQFLYAPVLRSVCPDSDDWFLVCVFLFVDRIIGASE